MEKSMEQFLEASLGTLLTDTFIGIRARISKEILAWTSEKDIGMGTEKKEDIFGGFFEKNDGELDL